jgi:hypothetical protein
VGIFNLNYDNIALTAMPGAYTGFDDGRFDPRHVHARGDFNEKSLLIEGVAIRAPRRFVL